MEVNPLRIAQNTKSGKPMVEFLGPNEQSPDVDARSESLTSLRRKV